MILLKDFIVNIDNKFKSTLEAAAELLHFANGEMNITRIRINLKLDDITPLQFIFFMIFELKDQAREPQIKT